MYVRYRTYIHTDPSNDSTFSREHMALLYGCHRSTAVGENAHPDPNWHGITHRESLS